MNKKRVSVSYVIRNETEPFHKNGVNALVLAGAPASCLFTACRDSLIRSWDVSNKNNISLINTYEHHMDWVNSIFYSSKHNLLISASSDTGVKIWDATKGFVMSTLRTHRDYVKKLSFAPDREIFASGGLDKKVCIWDVRTLKNLTTNNNSVSAAMCEGHKDSIYSLCITPCGTLLASGGTENFIRLWDPRTCLKAGKLKGHTEAVKALVLSPDGTQLLSGSTDGTVKLWSIGQQRCITTFRNHEEGVWAIAVDEDWTRFYSGGREKTLFETNLKTSENSFLLKENGSILDVVLDKNTKSLWLGTTETSVNRWSLPGRSGAAHSMDRPVIPGPSVTIKGGEGLKGAVVLSDKQHVLCTNSQGHGFLYNVLKGRLVKELGKIDLKEEVAARNRQEFIPNWFTVDVKTGMLTVHLDEGECFSAWVCIVEEGDNKINYGGLILQGLLQYWNPPGTTLPEPDPEFKPYRKQCDLPPHTPFALVEGSDGCGRTLFRIRVDETSVENDSIILEGLIPPWVHSLKVKNEMPKFTKIPFFIEQYSEDPPPKSREGRLSANDFLVIAKVIEYVADKILGTAECPSPAPQDIAIYCNRQRLQPHLDLRTVKHTIWKSGSDLRLMYLVSQLSSSSSS